MKGSTEKSGLSPLLVQCVLVTMEELDPSYANGNRATVDAEAVEPLVADSRTKILTHTYIHVDCRLHTKNTSKTYGLPCIRMGRP